MWRVLLLGLALVLMAGCKKDKKASQGPPPKPDVPVAAPNPAPGGSGLVHNPQGHIPGGGGVAAIQGVRTAVNRTVNLNEMRNLQLFIDTASGSGQMPTVQEITAAIQRVAPKTHQLIQSGAIVLTGTTSREGIWAYTANPQRVTGEYLVLTVQGPDFMTRDALVKRLR